MKKINKVAQVLKSINVQTDIKNEKMKTQDINKEVEQTLELLKQEPSMRSSEAFNERLWQKINEKYSIDDSFETLGLYQYRKTIMAIVIGLNVFIGAMLLYQGLTFVTTDRTTQLQTFATEYSLVSDMYSYSTDNSK